MLKEHTSYSLLQVNPHHQRPDCDDLFFCLAKLTETSKIEEAFTEKHRVSISLSIFESSKDNSPPNSRIIKNPVFDIELSRYGKNSYQMKTHHFYIDTAWAKDRGLGKYMIVKILNLLKNKVDHNYIGKLTFSLSSNQGKAEKARKLRNYFYKSIGCTLEGHEGDLNAWDTVEHARALLNFDSLPEFWNLEKVRETSLEKGLEELFSQRNQSKQKIAKQEDRLKFHKKHTNLIYKWQSRFQSFCIKVLQISFLTSIVYFLVSWFQDNL